MRRARHLMAQLVIDICRAGDLRGPELLQPKILIAELVMLLRTRLRTPMLADAERLHRNLMSDVFRSILDGAQKVPEASGRAVPWRNRPRKQVVNPNQERASRWNLRIM